MSFNLSTVFKFFICSFALAIGSLYIKYYFDDAAKKNALDMVEGIRKEMYQILKTVDWMDERTRYDFKTFDEFSFVQKVNVAFLCFIIRKNALDKARSMVNHIAYPDELLDDRKIEEFYSNVSELTKGKEKSNIIIMMWLNENERYSSKFMKITTTKRY